MTVWVKKALEEASHIPLGAPLQHKLSVTVYHEVKGKTATRREKPLPATCEGIPLEVGMFVKNPDGGNPIIS